MMYRHSQLNMLRICSPPCRPTAELTTLDKRKHEIVQLLQDEATYANATKFRDVTAELEAVEPKVAKLTSEWEKAAEALEKLTAE